MVIDGSQKLENFLEGLSDSLDRGRESHLERISSSQRQSGRVAKISKSKEIVRDVSLEEVRSPSNERDREEIWKAF